MIGGRDRIPSRPSGRACARGSRPSPTASGKELFARLQAEHPGVFPDGQLRTFQRRVKEWRQRRRAATGLRVAVRGRRVGVHGVWLTNKTAIGMSSAAT